MYSKYINGWNNNYEARYKDINVVAFGGTGGVGQVNGSDGVNGASE